MTLRPVLLGSLLGAVGCMVDNVTSSVDDQVVTSSAGALRDLGGYRLNFTEFNGTPPPTGWNRVTCTNSYDRGNTTYFPGMAASGTFVLFKLSSVSRADFERYWAFTASAPPPLPDTAIVDRLPYIHYADQTVAISRGDALVSGSVVVGGFSGCYRRTSPTSALAKSYEFNATPGTGTADPGDGRPYVTELCNKTDFGFVEIFVP